MEEWKQELENNVELLIRFLFKDFYIVEKNKVLDYYNYVKTRLDEVENLGASLSDKNYNEGSYEGQQELLESLFPELLNNK